MRQRTSSRLPQLPGLRAAMRAWRRERPRTALRPGSSRRAVRTLRWSTQRTTTQRRPPLAKNRRTASGRLSPGSARPKRASNCRASSMATGVFTGPRSARPISAATSRRTRGRVATAGFSS